MWKSKMFYCCLILNMMNENSEKIQNKIFSNIYPQISLINFREILTWKSITWENKIAILNFFEHHLEHEIGMTGIAFIWDIPKLLIRHSGEIIEEKDALLALDFFGVQNNCMDLSSFLLHYLGTHLTRFLP